MIKEKAICLLLIVIFIFTLAIGFYMQSKRKDLLIEFLDEIEEMTQKAMAKKKITNLNLNVEKIIGQPASAEGYTGLFKRDIFFRIDRPGGLKKSEEVIELPKEELKKRPIFKYKGRIMVGQTVMVIIEDDTTGKSLSVKEGDNIRDFNVVHIGEREIVLRKNDGEELVLGITKRERYNSEDENLDAKKEP